MDSSNEPAQERHLHWKFAAWDGDGEALEIHWLIEVSVIGYQCEADALLAVQDMVKRQHYRLRQVFECPTCGWQGKTAKAMQDMADAAQR